MPETLRAASRALAPPLGVMLAALLLSMTGPLVHLDTWLADLQRGQLAQDRDFSDLLMVDVDQASMSALESQLGAWPYERQIYALVNDYLRQQGAQVIVYDILFSDARGIEGDLALAASIRNHDSIVLAGVLNAGSASDTPGQAEQLQAAAWPVRGYRGPVATGAQLPIPLLAALAPTGIISVSPDADGLLRRIPLSVKVRDQHLPALALLALAQPRGLRELEYFPETRQARLGDWTWPVSGDQTVLLDLPRNMRDAPALPFYRMVLAALGAEGYALPAEQIRGRTVFIGSTMAVLGDYVYVPHHGRVAGLGVLALAYHSLKHGHVYQTAGAGWNGLILLLVGLPVLLFPRRYRSGLSASAGLVLAGLALSLAVQLALLMTLRQQALLVAPALSAGLLFVLAIGMRFKHDADEQERLARSALAAQEAAALESRFLAHMTHELRTPLTAIIGYNQLLASGKLDESERRHNIGIVDRSAQHLLSLINNILDQSKIEAGQMALDRKPVALAAAIEDTLLLLRSVAEPKGLTLSATVANSVPPYLMLDSLRLRQILINLIGNGLKFTRHGGVSVSASWLKDELRLTVHDTGPGIPKDVMRRLFVAFQQASASIAAEHGGTGLGLTISKNLAQLMGGGVTVESELGQGSSFHVLLHAPVAPAPTPAQQQRAVLQGEILLADDNPDNRNLLVLYLKKMGLKVVTADNGRMALEQVERHAPDLVLMDMEMPEMNGVEATRALRAAGFCPPILALTAHTDAQEQQKARDAGCNDVLVKPITPEALKTALEQHMRAPAAGAT